MKVTSNKTKLSAPATTTPSIQIVHHLANLIFDNEDIPLFSNWTKETTLVNQLIEKGILPQPLISKYNFWTKLVDEDKSFVISHLSQQKNLKINISIIEQWKPLLSTELPKEILYNPKQSIVWEQSQNNKNSVKRSVTHECLLFNKVMLKVLEVYDESKLSKEDLQKKMFVEPKMLKKLIRWSDLSSQRKQVLVNSDKEWFCYKIKQEMTLLSDEVELLSETMKKIDEKEFQSLLLGEITSNNQKGLSYLSRFKQHQDKILQDSEEKTTESHRCGLCNKRDHIIDDCPENISRANHKRKRPTVVSKKNLINKKTLEDLETDDEDEECDEDNVVLEKM